MKDYLNEVYNKFPIRRTKKQKEAFTKYIIEEANSHNYIANIESIKNNNNIIIGNYHKAKVVFTAHYDTPAASIIPNLMMPRNIILSFCYAFGYAIILAIISILLSDVIQISLGLDDWYSIIFFLLIYFGSFFVSMRFFVNKHNKNDNTSGVATILSLMEKNPNSDIAFILFDNEEKGLLGSKAFSKANKELFKDKLLINLDCVANGNNILFIAKDEAIKLNEYSILKESIKSNESFEIHHYPMKGSMGNSDHKNFNCGIGVMAAHKGKGKIIKFYCGRIHTKWDTVAYPENIEFLSNSLTSFIKNL